MSEILDRFQESLREALELRRERGLHRQLRAAGGVDFASNDYLALSRHESLRQELARRLETVPLGAPASRLLRGNEPSHERVEAEFAAYKGAEAALFFPSGYQANVGLLTALVGPDDTVFSDALNHASIIDGLRLSRARKEIVPHLDLDALKRRLRESSAKGRRLVVTESVFSMDGDLASLRELVALAARYDAVVVVDEAHATGLYGEARGSGRIESEDLGEEVVAAVSTCGKALGLCGAFVTGSRTLREHLINHSRAFIYSTAPTPVLAEAISIALRIAQDEPWRRERVHENATALVAALRGKGIDVPRARSPIVPVSVGDNHAALRVAGRLQSRGLDVRALRPPTVPEGTARLRISVHADHTDEQLESLADAIGESLGNEPQRGGLT